MDDRQVLTAHDRDPVAALELDRRMCPRRDRAARQLDPDIEHVTHVDHLVQRRGSFGPKRSGYFIIGAATIILTGDLCVTGTVTLWDTGAMKNITVVVPDDIYRTARIRAAERGTSVSALVTEFLGSLSDTGPEFARLVAQQRLIQAQIQHFRASDRLDRDEAHERAVR